MNIFIKKYLIDCLIRISVLIALTVLLSIYKQSVHIAIVLSLVCIYYTLLKYNIYLNFKNYLSTIDGRDYNAILLGRKIKVIYIDGIYLKGIKYFPICLNGTNIVVKCRGEFYASGFNSKNFIFKKYDGDIIIETNAFENEYIEHQLILNFPDSTQKPIFDIEELDKHMYYIVVMGKNNYRKSGVIKKNSIYYHSIGDDNV